MEEVALEAVGAEVLAVVDSVAEEWERVDSEEAPHAADLVAADLIAAVAVDLVVADLVVADLVVAAVLIAGEQAA